MTASQGKPASGGLAGWDDVKSPANAPVLEYVELAAGAIVKHVGTKNIEKNGKRYQLHTFQSAGGMGQVFALWGAVELNGKIRELRPGAVLFLQYGGKSDHPDDLVIVAEQRRTMHSFSVKQAPPGADVVAIRRDFDEAALERKIRLAGERERASRSAGRADDPPPHTDDDFPFGANARV